MVQRWENIVLIQNEAISVLTVMNQSTTYGTKKTATFSSNKTFNSHQSQYLQTLYKAISLILLITI